MELALITLALSVVLSYVVIRELIKRKRVERVFFARGYVFVKIRMIDMRVYKGFMQRGLLRMVSTESNAFQVVLESYKTGALSTINTKQISSIDVLKPPVLRTSKNPFKTKNKRNKQK